MGDQINLQDTDESINETKDQKETLLQRRERVLGIRSIRYVHKTPNTATKSGDKQRSRVLQAQRMHRQRTIEYITELENEIFRLRASESNLTQMYNDKDRQPQYRRSEEVQASTERNITLHVLIHCLNGQIAPGLFLNSQWSSDVKSQAQLQLSDTRRTWMVPDPCLFLGYDTLSILNPQPAQKSIQRSIESLDPLTKMLFSNFSENIAPTLIPFDGPSNGYRTLLLPLACEDELVQAALLASSANQLRFKHPSLLALATTSQAAAIDKLSKLSAGGKFNDPATLAAIVLLMINGIINGGADLQILLDMAKSWTSAMEENGNPRQSALDEFLLEQVNIIELYAKPLLHEKAMIRSQTMTDMESENFSSKSNMYEIFSSLESVIKQACAIYSYHILNDGPPDRIDDLLETLKSTALRIPNHTPGENALAWVYFIAAAETLSFTKRNFFVKRLMGVYERGTFSDMTTSFNVLHQIWNCQVTGNSWTKVLIQMPLVIR